MTEPERIAAFKAALRTMAERAVECGQVLPEDFDRFDRKLERAATEEARRDIFREWLLLLTRRLGQATARMNYKNN